MSAGPNDAIFRQVTLPDGKSIGQARIVVHVMPAPPDGGPSPIRVGVWHQRQGMIAQAFVGDVVEVETSVGAFQVPHERQQIAVTVAGGGTVLGRELGCQCGVLPHVVIPDVF